MTTRNLRKLARYYRSHYGLSIRDSVAMAAEHERPFEGQFWTVENWQ